MEHEFFRQIPESISKLAGVEELWGPNSETLSGLEKFLRVVNSVGMHVDARAMLGLVSLFGGFSHEEEVKFTFKYGLLLYTSPVLKDSQREDEVVDVVACAAIGLAQQLLKMTPEQVVQLSPEDKANCAKALSVTNLLIDAISTYEQQRDNGDGATLREEDNMKKDVTEEERLCGEANPEQRELKEVLRQAICDAVGDDQKEQERIFNEIKRISELSVERIALIQYHKAVDPVITKVASVFWDRWFSRPEYEEMRIKVAAKGLRRLLNLGADVDLLFRLKGVPVGKELFDKAKTWLNMAREDHEKVIPYFLGKDLDELRKMSLSWFEIFQLAYQHAARERGVVSGDDSYEDQIETPEESVNRLREILQALIRAVPILGFEQDPDDVKVMSRYGPGRSFNVTFFTQENGEPGLVTVPIIDAWNVPNARLVTMLAHELKHGDIFKLALAALRAHFTKKNGEPVTEGDIHLSTRKQEILTESLEELIPTEIDGLPNETFSPRLLPFREDLHISKLGESPERAIVRARQVPFGLTNYAMYKALETRLGTEGAENLTEEDILFITNYGASVGEYMYAFAFKHLGIRHGYRGVGIDLSFSFADGIRYVLSDMLFGTVEDESDEDIIATIVRVMRDRSGEQRPLEKRDWRAVFFSVILYTLSEKDERKWSDYLRSCTPQEAYEMFASIGIKPDQI